jgi:DNA-binding transcriptional LysR family regulator
MRELRNIQIFAEVANCQSFSKAAKNLMLTPSAVSMSVQKLESALGTRLLTRTTRQLSLTSDGQAFLEHAQQGLGKIYEAIDLLCDRDGPPSGPLRISSVSSFGRSYVLPALPEFMAQYPDITLDISFNDHMPDLIREKVDLGLFSGEPDNDTYVGRHLCAPPMVLVASPAYLAANEAPQRPADLSRHKIVGVRPRDGAVPSWTIRERLALATTSSEPAVFQPKSCFSISECQDSAIDAALAGLGLALVLRKSAAGHIKNGALVALLPTYDISITGGNRVFLMYPSKKYLPGRVRVFIDFLVEVSRRDGWNGGPVVEEADPDQEFAEAGPRAARR